MSKSKQLFEQAQSSIPGGVNSPVRAFKGVGGSPVFMDHAEGPYIYDVDGKRYIDFIGSWGPMILGHNHPAILEATLEAVKKGLSFGTPTATEVAMAEKVKSIMPSIEKVRMVNSGTEATMSAIRLARGYTGRNKILKFEGCYHGHADSLLVKAGSGALTLGVPSSPGIPEDVAKHTLTASFNNPEHVKEIFAQHGDDIACVIVEPVPGNMNCIPPQNNFLQFLRDITTQYSSVFIIDEVMTGFRVARGGAQSYYGVTPDLTCLGKVIGGGMPVGAFGGKQEIMDFIAPVGPVYQAGTLSGNPVAMSAGLAALNSLPEQEEYDALEKRVIRLIDGFKQHAAEYGISLATSYAGGMFGLFFTDKETIHTYEEATQCNMEQFQAFFHAMLDEGVYLAPSAYEAGFISFAHTDEVIDETLACAKRAFAKIADKT